MDKTQPKFKLKHWMVLNKKISRWSGWLVVLISHLAYGIWSINGISQQQKHLHFICDKSMHCANNDVIQILNHADRKKHQEKARLKPDTSQKRF